MAITIHGSEGIKSDDTTNDVIIERESTDGNIVTLQKDGTTVGSIGSGAGIYLNGVNGGFRIHSGGTKIFPCTTSNTANDNVTDLGAGDARWKNLYLSGGVYLGGTGSANYLDDYEEGTWTPTNSTGGATISVNGANYTKIGRMVFAQAYIAIGGNASSNNAIIGGLPFAVRNNDNFSPSVFNYNQGSNEAIAIRAESGTSTAIIQTFQNNTQNWSRFSSSIGIFTIVYETDA